MSASMSTCLAQFNSMNTATRFLGLVKMMKKREGGGRVKRVGWGGGKCEDRDAGGLWEKRSSEGVEEASTRIQGCLFTSDIKMCTGICQWVGNKYDFSCCP